LLGRSHLAAGRAADALPALERAVEQASTAGFLANQPLRLAWLGEAHLLIGQARRADDIARQAYELARAQGERGHEAYAGRLMGSVARHRAEPDGAEAAYQTALALAEKLGMRPLVAHCHLGLGKLYRRTGDRAKAAEHLATATAMYREMDMGFWLEQAEAKQRASG
jgi:tetratricopeptide (TPR) repeat protein